ncbi:DUF2620 domain-containing protein [Vibrio aestuarianus]|uniref:DUF2620 domain-containing protein n=1 Tax=Vibrio aestuarianus TaxID=28171 RepID=A0ABN8TJV2_9VIBR|nr:DUF2620 domain-containing protein [Vibrio aestuarianus]MDE1213453.1 DUF2620 domain-containing protein [Vibrio aestuarianus]MDE1219113.1 DUF2620 domain-containing protein [Vibrio aestuarianus]MDE1229597.1 DUF2620 domain-containing protein [Vibrio aestuarianus]MDE1250864.1 DUF2620 domain-containing protein [Vibrio aestuarianus]MDE1258536.1 DUF2620 domain-containing protein [Vibrio aestuarianus]
MKKIAIAGLQREQVRDQIEAAAPGVFECHILTDMEAAMKVKSGEMDYFIGSCNTGAGGALAMAIALIGFNKSCTIAKPSIQAKEDEVASFIEKGYVAFGLSIEHIEHAVPLLARQLANQ